MLDTFQSSFVILVFQCFAAFLQLHRYKRKNYQYKNGTALTPFAIAKLIKTTTAQCSDMQEYKSFTLFTSLFLGMSFINPHVAYGFLFGIVLMKSLSRICVSIVTSGNIKTALSSNVLNSGFTTAYSYGIGGAMVISAGITIIYISSQFLSNLFSISMAAGISLNSLMIRSSGGIYTKSADVGADLLGKVSEQMDEDSIQNPLFIADNVGDNIGDANAAMNGIIESAAFAIALFSKNHQACVFFMVTMSVVSLCTVFVPRILGKFVILTGNDVVKKILSIFVLTFVFLSLSFVGLSISSNSLFQLSCFEIIMQYIIAIVAIFFVMCNTIFFTYDKFNPIKSIIRSTETGGTPLNAIRSIGESMISASMIPLLILLSYLVAYFMLGHSSTNFIPTSLAIMVGFIPIIMATDLYGPIVDNAGGIAVAGNMDPGVRDNTDSLDQMGNMSKALTKSYSTFLMIMCSLLAIAAMFNRLDYTAFASTSPSNPISKDILQYIGLIPIKISFSALLSGGLVFVFAGSIMRSVDKISIKAMKIGSELLQNLRSSTFEDNVEQIKSNASSLPRSIMEMSIKSSNPLMLFSITPIMIMSLVYLVHRNNSMLATLIPIACGFQIGALCTGSLLSIFMTNCGGAMDNVSKAIDAKYKRTKKSISTEIHTLIDSVNTDNNKIKLSFDDQCIKLNGDAKISDITKKYNDYQNCTRIIDSGSEGDVIGDPLKDSAGNSITSIVSFIVISCYMVTEIC